MRRLMYKYGGVSVVVVIIAIIIAAVFVVGNNTYYAEKTVTTTVCSKERVAKKRGAEYRVYTADSGSYVMKDIHWPFNWRTNSADVYGELSTPGTYKVTYVGWRFSPFSWFHNIVSYEKVADNKAQLAKCGSSS